MNTENEKDIMLVEKYFDQELSEAEINLVNTRIETDGNFKAIFNQEKTLIKAIHYDGLLRDLEMLKKVERDIHHKAPIRKTIQLNAWYFKVAAALTIFAIAASLIFPIEEDPERLFQSYFKPYPNLFEPTMRGSDEGMEPAEAFLAYDNGDYQRALVGFKEILKNGNDPGVLLLTGNANLKLGNIDDAKNNFLILIKNYDELDTQAKWFLSLCYLKEGDVDQAKMMWEELSGTEISYSNKAKELLKKVN